MGAALPLRLDRRCSTRESFQSKALVEFEPRRNRTLGNERLESYLANASDDLPTVPAVATRIIDALDDPDVGVEEVSELIHLDPSLTARILKVSNSSMYGFPMEIQGLGHAMSLVGARAVRNLVMAVAMRETYKVFGPLEQMLWEHSMAAGPATAALAAEFAPGVDADDAFSVGLLHDIGKTALSNSHHDEYEEVTARVFGSDTSFVEAERETFGFDHAELGGRIAKSWALPSRAVAVIQHHHDAGALETLPPEDAQLTALVTVTTGCLARLGAGRPAPFQEFDVSSLPAWGFLGLDESKVDVALEICEERISAAKAFAA